MKFKRSEYEKWMKEHSHFFEFIEETDNTLIVKVTLFKDKWYCENCKLGFNEPEWIETPSSENPCCPNCESMNVDLTKNVAEFQQKLSSEGVQ